MFRDINQIELGWIEKLFSVDFAGKEILQKQIEKAKISLEKNYDYISLKFSIKGAPEKFPYKVRVPIEMRAFQKKFCSYTISSPYNRRYDFGIGNFNCRYFKN